MAELQSELRPSMFKPSNFCPTLLWLERGNKIRKEDWDCAVKAFNSHHQLLSIINTFYILAYSVSVIFKIYQESDHFSLCSLLLSRSKSHYLSSELLQLSPYKLPCSALASFRPFIPWVQASPQTSHWFLTVAFMASYLWSHLLSLSGIPRKLASLQEQ